MKKIPMAPMIPMRGTMDKKRESASSIQNPRIPDDFVQYIDIIYGNQRFPSVFPSLFKNPPLPDDDKQIENNFLTLLKQSPSNVTGTYS